MENSKEVKDCPFCGAGARVTWDMYRKYVMVYCPVCGARTAPCQYGRHKGVLGSIKCGSDGKARATAIERWNQRAGG